MRANISAGLVNDNDDYSNNGMNVLSRPICFGKGFWIKTSDRLQVVMTNREIMSPGSHMILMLLWARKETT